MVPDTDVINIIEEMSESSAQEHDTSSLENELSSLSSLKEKISRTAQFLQDLKLLSKEFQDLEGDQEEKDKQIFTRRIVQVGAEIQDARDLLSVLCKHRLPERQWRLLFEAIEEPDCQNSCLSGFDVDPSVQFFGIDWERVFGRCFSLSMQIKQLETIFKENSVAELDLLIVNKMLRELAAIEADVLSHSEAVLRGRLSKSQRQLIFDEQLKYASITATKPQKALPKSKSFRDPSHKSRPIKYKKNKTTNLDKLTSSMSAHTLKCSSSSDEDQQAMLDKKSTVVTISPVKRKNSGSFMQNVTSMFKNIR